MSDTAPHTLPVDAWAVPAPEAWMLADARLHDVDRWRARCLDALREDGVCLLQTDLADAAQFETLVRALGFAPAERYGDLPNSAAAPRVFETTPYPPTESILFHNEASHTPRAPQTIFFLCLQPAQQGGATPLSDGALAWQRLAPSLQEALRTRGLTYIRRFLPHFDVSWRQFFGTDDRAAVEAQCASEGMEIRWIDADALELRHTTRAVGRHPRCGWTLFHQLALHHPAFLDPLVREYFEGAGPGLARTVVFGDGGEIPDAWAEAIHRAQMQASYTFPWRAGMVAILDNTRMAHARAPYAGPRRHLVMLSALTPIGDLWFTQDMP